MMTRTCGTCSLIVAIVAAGVLMLSALGADAYKDGQYPPPLPPVLQWEDLLSGALEDHWTDMNTAIHSPTYSLKADPENEKGHVLMLTRRPTGLMRSMKAYENFILECEWRHLTEAPSSAGTKDTTGNSGLYVWADPVPTVGGNFTRAIEVQVCNLGNGKWYTSHGDLFPIWGAKMTPDPRFGVSGTRSMPIEFRGKKTGEWNRIRVTCVDGTIQEEVNGAVVSAGFRASPRKGYLCVESEGGPIEFRNMRVHELAGDPNLKESDVAAVLPSGTRGACLYNGVNLDGWTIAEGQLEQWHAQDHVLHCDGKTASEGISIPIPIQTDVSMEFTLIADWSQAKELPFAIEGWGEPIVAMATAVPDAKKGWNRAKISYRSGHVSMTVNDQKFWDTDLRIAGKFEPRLRLKNLGQAVNFSNLLVIVPPKQK